MPYRNKQFWGQAFSFFPMAFPMRWMQTALLYAQTSGQALHWLLPLTSYRQEQLARITAIGPGLTQRAPL